ncbi:MAG: peroxiredoxin [Rhodothermales bacterium]|jgi:peroxiredoxin
MRFVSTLLLALSLFVLPAAAQTVGQTAPDFFFPQLGGGTVRLSDHQGKVVFVFLFGNTCSFCLAVGHRTESEVNGVHGGNPSFQAVGLDMWTSSSSTASVTSFKNRTGVSYPLGLQAGSMAHLYGTTYDRLLVIGADGILRFKSSSNVSSSLDAAKAVVADLLATIALDSEDQPNADFSLATGYPNPFSSGLEIAFQTPSAGQVRLSLIDLLGREVAVLADGLLPAGIHRVSWSVENGLPPGVYTSILTTPRGRATRTQVLIR